MQILLNLFYFGQIVKNTYNIFDLLAGIS